MPREAHHSKNWGGKREGAGRPMNSANRLTQQALEIVAESKEHPLKFLLGVMADTKQTMKLRTDAAQSVLPYCLSRLNSTEINVTGTIEQLSDEEIQTRLIAASLHLQEYLPKLKLIEGEAMRK